jgi:hypothetical protein
MSLNAGIPPAAIGRWSIRLQAAFPDRRSAEDAEQLFKDRSGSKLASLGKEFFWGDDLDAQIMFSNLPGVTRF